MSGINVLILLLASFLLAHFLGDWRSVRRFAHRSVEDRFDAIGATLGVAGAVSAQVPRRALDTPFLGLRWLEVLGASPGYVLRSGGCCSGVARLAIVSLQTLGIRAGQITVYNSREQTHCFLEIVCEGRSVAVDPYYGIYYVDAGGGDFIGMRDLQAGIRPVLRSLPGCRETGYPDDDYYAFDYPRTRTAKWSGSAWRRALYAALKATIGTRIDTLKLHPVFEWPQLVLVMGLCAAAGCLNACALL